MTVKIYTGEKIDQGLSGSAHKREVDGIIEICRLVWDTFQKHEDFYAIVVSPNYPRADLVIISQRGVGVVELKSNEGKIRYYGDDQWFADALPIQAGADYRSNPHDQVRQYARTIKKKIYEGCANLIPAKDYDAFKKMHVQTAVCFTSPQADFSQLVKAYHPQCEYWETFEILSPEKIIDWVFALRMGVETREKVSFEPFVFSPEMVEFIARNILKGQEWEQIYDLMPSTDPYGYLLISEDSAKSVYALRTDVVSIGRDIESCQVIIPARCEKVSRIHATLERTVSGILFTDFSRNGAFFQGKKVEEPVILHDKMLLVLGGPEVNENTCSIRFIARAEEIIRLRTTDLNLTYIDPGVPSAANRTTFLDERKENNLSEM